MVPNAIGTMDRLCDDDDDDDEAAAEPFIRLFRVPCVDDLCALAGGPPTVGFLDGSNCDEVQSSQYNAKFIVRCLKLKDVKAGFNKWKLK